MELKVGMGGTEEMIILELLSNAAHSGAGEEGTPMPPKTMNDGKFYLTVKVVLSLLSIFCHQLYLPAGKIQNNGNIKFVLL